MIIWDESLPFGSYRDRPDPPQLQEPAAAMPEEPEPAYPDAEQSPNFPQIEQAILARWKSERIFERSVENRRDAGAPEFVFYDGPPFANGLPHYGHLVTGFIK